MALSFKGTSKDAQAVRSLPTDWVARMERMKTYQTSRKSKFQVFTELEQTRMRAPHAQQPGTALDLRTDLVSAPGEVMPCACSWLWNFTRVWMEKGTALMAPTWFADPGSRTSKIMDATAAFPRLTACSSRDQPRASCRCHPGLGVRVFTYRQRPDSMIHDDDDGLRSIHDTKAHGSLSNTSSTLLNIPIIHKHREVIGRNWATLI